MSESVVSQPGGMAFLASVYSASWRAAFGAINTTSTYEMLRLFDQIDRRSLRLLMSTAESVKFDVDLPRIRLAAHVVMDRATPSDSSRELVREAQQFLGKRRPLIIPSDPTGTLPVVNMCQPGLAASDYAQAATDLGVETAAVRAVATVEAGGQIGFFSSGMPKLRFELHRFRGYTKNAYDVTHPHLSASYVTNDPQHTGSAAREWSMLYGAMLLANGVDAAIMSSSWGMFQIMGESWRAMGFGSARDFAASMYTSAGQLDGFVRFCRMKGVVKHLAARDWAKFAYGYNGSKYAEYQYDVKMAAAYARLKAEESKAAASKAGTGAKAHAI